MSGALIGVRSWSLHLPGEPLRVGGFTSTEACPPERAHELLGRKGLLGKEPATRMALCAVHGALDRPVGGPRPSGPPDPDTAVVVGSNLGNVCTVWRVAGAVGAGAAREISPLDAPNASSNVIASSVAIWFRFGGPNFMVCSGATAGLDAVRLAAVLLRAGRARRVVVVGVEPDDDVAAALHRSRRAAPRHSLRAAAACVVLDATPIDAGLAVQVPPWCSAEPCGEPDLVVGDADTPGADGRLVDVAALVGDTYGAAGVIHLAVGAGLLATGTGTSARIVCGDGVDGWRAVDLSIGRGGT